MRTLFRIDFSLRSAVSLFRVAMTDYPMHTLRTQSRNFLVSMKQFQIVSDPKPSTVGQYSFQSIFGFIASEGMSAIMDLSEQ